MDHFMNLRSVIDLEGCLDRITFIIRKTIIPLQNFVQRLPECDHVVGSCRSPLPEISEADASGNACRFGQQLKIVRFEVLLPQQLTASGNYLKSVWSRAGSQNHFPLIRHFGIKTLVVIESALKN